MKEINVTIKVKEEITDAEVKALVALMPYWIAENLGIEESEISLSKPVDHGKISGTSRMTF